MSNTGRPLLDLAPFMLDDLAPLPFAYPVEPSALAVPYRGLHAQSDVEAMQVWLSRVARSPATFSNYRKEVERFLLWSQRVQRKALSALRYEDFVEYERFLTDPQPRELWVASSGHRYSRTSPHWRPFQGPLVPASRKLAMTTLNSLMTWLVTAGYLQGNPLALGPRRSSALPKSQLRYLTPQMWHDVKSYIQGMSRDTPVRQKEALRARWLVTLLYLGALRISEVANTVMSQFVSEQSGAQTLWWLCVEGKGQKLRKIPVGEDFLAELVQYRESHQLPSLPDRMECTPLILPFRNRGGPLTRSALHTALKNIFRDTAYFLSVSYPEDPARAQSLLEASAHWLRHTAGSHMVDNQVDIRMVRDTLGHESITTTNQYLHIDDDRRHHATTQKHLVGWKGLTRDEPAVAQQAIPDKN
jgi:integrase/recombinase XerD